MFDIGWSEMMMLAVLAIIVIGPKDLPKAMRTVGRLVRRARNTVREFQDSVDDMVRESELDELRQSAKDIADLTPQNQIAKWTDPTGFDADGEDRKQAGPTAVPSPLAAANIAPDSDNTASSDGPAPASGAADTGTPATETSNVTPMTPVESPESAQAPDEAAGKAKTGEAKGASA